MFKEYFELDKDEMLYSSKVFYPIIPTYIILRFFVFYVFEALFRRYSKKYSKTYSTLSESNKLEWTSRATSIFHAILVTVLCIPHTLTDIIYRESDNDLAYGITKRRVDVLLWTLAYLVYDSWSMFRMYGKNMEKAMVLHHVVCITAITLGMYLNIGTVYMGAFLINEISSPFLHFRWYLSRLNKRDSTLATINNIVFALLYLIFRGIWNTYVVGLLCIRFYFFREELHKSTVPYWMIISLPPFAISHLLLNYYWLSLIVLHLVHPKSSRVSSEDSDITITTNENTPLLVHNTDTVIYTENL